MAKAKITDKDGYQCCPNGFKVELFQCGTIVDGKVAKWALADRAASAMFDPREETKVVAPDETKATTKKSGRSKKKG